MSEHPKFAVSARVRAWASRRPGPQHRPSDTPPPCVDCDEDDDVADEPTGQA